MIRKDLLKFQIARMIVTASRARKDRDKRGMPINAHFFDGMVHGLQELEKKIDTGELDAEKNKGEESTDRQGRASERTEIPNKRSKNDL